MPAIVTEAAKPARVAPPPANDDRKSAIVTAKHPRRRQQLRRRARHDAGGAQAARRCRRCAVPRAGAPDRRRRANDRPAGPAPALAQLRRRPAADRREALDEPFSAFPSWFMRITCDRCGKDRMISETHGRSTARHADPRDHRPHAPRRLRRQGREGRADDRHRYRGSFRRTEAHDDHGSRAGRAENRDAQARNTRSATDCRRLERSGWKRGEHTEIGPPQDAADPIQVSVWPTVYAVQSEARPGRSPGWMIAF